MPVLPEEIQWYKSTVNNNTGDNGGSMSANQIPASAMNNVWPNVSQAERVAGVIQYRKIFCAVNNPDTIQLVNNLVFINRPTPGGSRLNIFTGAYNTQNNLSGTERCYSAGKLVSDIVPGATSLAVLTEDASDGIFQVGDLIRISNKSAEDQLTGQSNYVRVAALSWDGNIATLYLVEGEQVADSFSASDTYVSSCIEVPAIGSGEAALAIWQKRIIPANTTSVAVDGGNVVVIGASAS